MGNVTNPDLSNKHLNFTISDNAAKRIRYLLQNETEGSMLKITVIGGGCSGFQYNYDFVQQLEPGDHLFENNNAKIIIDDLSINNFLNGSQLDFIEKLGESYFRINNPNSNSRCGCGNSFAI